MTKHKQLSYAHWETLQDLMYKVTRANEKPHDYATAILSHELWEKLGQKVFEKIDIHYVD